MRQQRIRSARGLIDDGFALDIARLQKLVAAEQSLMPLSEDGRSVNVILGALTFDFDRAVLPGFWSGAKLDPSTATLIIIEDEAVRAYSGPIT